MYIHNVHVCQNTFMVKSQVTDVERIDYITELTNIKNDTEKTQLYSLSQPIFRKYNIQDITDG